MSLVDQSWTKVDGLEVADQPKESTRDQFDIKTGKLNNKINEKKKQINQEQALEKRLAGAPITSNWSAICKSESTQSYDYLPQCLPGWSPAVTNYRHLSVIMFMRIFFSSKSVFNIINLQLHYEIKICFTKNSVFQSH